MTGSIRKRKDTATTLVLVAGLVAAIAMAMYNNTHPLVATPQQALSASAGTR